MTQQANKRNPKLKSPLSSLSSRRYAVSVRKLSEKEEGCESVVLRKQEGSVSCMRESSGSSHVDEGEEIYEHVVTSILHLMGGSLLSD
ncbi:unnamed protein product [Sphenostylis stenocarpa]|uniref:Uncharacterized protein n=1 Tax=Sphenostylis stenocarpa TaxID=92480 RepID=A0AA86SAJ0_9FABA|nr:unnamed protein product [Sphenostylis stenocarpa]